MFENFADYSSYAFTRNFGEQLKISNDLQAGMIGTEGLDGYLVTKSVTTSA